MQLLLLYCIVIQSCALRDGSTLTQAESEISGETARHAKDYFLKSWPFLNSPNLRLLRGPLVKRPPITNVFSTRLEGQSSLFAKEGDNSGRKGKMKVFSLWRDIMPKWEYYFTRILLSYTDQKIYNTANDSVTNERNRLFKEMNSKFFVDLMTSSQLDSKDHELYKELSREKVPVVSEDFQLPKIRNKRI